MHDGDVDVGQLDFKHDNTTCKALNTASSSSNYTALSSHHVTPILSIWTLYSIMSKIHRIEYKLGSSRRSLLVSITSILQAHHCALYLNTSEQHLDGHCRRPRSCSHEPRRVPSLIPMRWKWEAPRAFSRYVFRSGDSGSCRLAKLGLLQLFAMTSGHHSHEHFNNLAHNRPSKSIALPTHLKSKSSRGSTNPLLPSEAEPPYPTTSENEQKPSSSSLPPPSPHLPSLQEPTM
jgi:hypothetical protein